MYLKLILIVFVSKSSAQLTSPSEAVCVGEQVVFVCQQIGGISRWTVGNLPRGISGFTATALSSLAGMVYSIHDDPGFGFEIYVLPSSSSSSVISELRVTAVRQLNGVTLRCEGGNGSFVSTIQIASIDAPSGVMTSHHNQFTPSTASITLTWSVSSGADNYTIMVTPLLPSGQSLVSTTTTCTSLQLTVLYNEEYSINITAQNCAGSNSTIVPLTVVGCNSPSPLANGSISEYSSGAVGAMLTFQCDTGYMPQEEVTSTCLSNKSWVPTPECQAALNHEPDLHTPQPKGSGNTLSTGIQVTITAIVCSLVCFTLGVLVGAFFNRCVTVQCLCKSKSNPTSPAPVVYEEVSPDSHTERKNDIELNENVAYGPVANMSV